MNKKNKGFTLTELLAVIVIIAILATVVTYAVSAYIQKGKDEYNKGIETQVITTAKSFYPDNSDRIPVSEKEYDYVTLKELSTANYLKGKVVDADERNCMEQSYVTVEKTEKGLEYTACLICEDGSDKKSYIKDKVSCHKDGPGASEFVVKYWNGQELLKEEIYYYQEVNYLISWDELDGSIENENKGWTFKGWSASNTSTEIIYENSEQIEGLGTEVIDLYAVYERNITFKHGVNSEEVTTGIQRWNPYETTGENVGGVTSPALKQITSWTSLGFRNDTLKGESIYNAGEVVYPEVEKSNILYGVYEKNHTVKFYSGAAKSKETNKTAKSNYSSSEIALPTTVPIVFPNKDECQDISNWEELGWRKDTTADAKEYSFGATINTKFTTTSIYATYKRTLTISYDGNGGTGSVANTTKDVYLNSNQTTTSSQTVTLASNNFSKTGYTFSKWAEGSTSGTKYAEKASYTPGVAYNASTFGKTIFATWTANIYKVTLNNQSATTAGTTEVYYQYNTTKTINGVLCYYYTDSALTKCLDKGYNIIPPTKTGYTFGGYFTQTGGNGTQYVLAGSSFTNSIYKTTGDKTLYAKWTANIYTVTLNNQSATTKGTEKVYYRYNTTETINGTTCYFYSDSALKNCLPNGYTITTPTKTGHTFGGYFTSTGGNGTQYIYSNGNFTNQLWKTVGDTTLYAKWTAKSKSITIKMEYDTTKYGEPSAEYKTSTYQSLSSTSETLSYGNNKTITASPAYPDDRYTGTVSCTNGITATLTEGTGTTSRTDSIILTNNADSTSASTCTITYTPKWQGIPYGTYTEKKELTYGGFTWTITKDFGNNVGIAANTIASDTGEYMDNIYSKVSNTTMKNDADKGGLVKQDNGYYITTNGGISEGLTSYNYWTGSGKIYNAADRNHREYKKVKHLSGFAISRDGTSDLSVTTINTGVTKKATTSKGIISTTSSYFSISGDKITFKDADYTTESTANKYARWMTKFILGGGAIGGLEDYPNSLQLAYNTRIYEYDEGTYTITENALVGDTARMTMYICGGNSTGKRIINRYKSSTYFYYGNEATGTGWGTNGWTTSTAVSYAYENDDGERWVEKFAGRAFTCDPTSDLDDPADCVNQYSSDGSTLQRLRYYRFDTFEDPSDNKYCGNKTKYTISDVTKTLYYRPYVRVRQR